MEKHQASPAGITAPGHVSRWNRFRRTVERTGLDQYETLLPFPFSLTFWSGGAKPRQLLYFTKDHLCRRWVEEGIFPRDMVALVRYGVPTPECLDCVRHVSRGFNLPLVFVGDLDPLDLTIFFTLRTGNPELRPSRTGGLRVAYGGIDDAWLTLALKHQIRATNPLFRPMGELESAHFRLIDEAAHGLKRMIGARSYDLLRSGQAMEMETAYSPGLYPPTFAKLLLGHLKKRSK